MVELERIQDQDNEYIKYAVGLERHITEGRYNKVSELSASSPTNVYVPLTKKLVETARF